MVIEYRNGRGLTFLSNLLQNFIKGIIMNYIDHSSNLFLKITYAAVGYLITCSTYLSSSDSSFSDSSFSSIIPSKHLIQISPKPPDPALQHLKCLMKDDFQLPFYPEPDLSAITGQLNSYALLESGSFAINPNNDKFMVTSIARDRFTDGAGIFYRYSQGAVIALSNDRGKTWTHTAIENPICLGGHISQQVQLNSLSYAKSGLLYATGDTSDMHVNPPFSSPRSLILFSRSKDNGHTWSTPIVLDSSVPNNIVNNTGFAVQTAVVKADPAHDNLVHLTYSTDFHPSTFYGNIYYVRSEDNGVTWSAPLEIYDMAKDPVWLKEHADHSFSPIGGQNFAPSGPVIVDQDVIVVPITRLYPKIGSTTYTQDPSDSNFDRAVVRSTDNGKTWSKIAGTTPQTIFADAHDPSKPAVFSNIVNDGGGNSPCVFSPYTGRLYLAYQAGNTKLKPNPEVAQFFPYIALNASSDRGETWTHTVKINRTPTHIIAGAQQAFNPNLIYTANGFLVVAYNDFRNWTGGSSFIQTDAWLDIYRETSSPNGGNTGIGLDFVKEVRLTPTSFNGNIGFNSAIQGIGQTIGLGLNKKNEVFATFGITNQDTIPPFIGFRNMTVDINNRINVFIKHVKFALPSNM